MVKTELTLPELGLLVGTRGLLGLGIGLLVAHRLSRDSRRGAGWALATVGALSTIPLAWMVYRGRERALGGTEGGARKAAHQPVRDIMSRDVQVISPEASLAEAGRRMRDGNFGMMPVGENDRMVGAISDRDHDKRLVGIVALGDIAVEDSIRKPAAEALTAISEPA